MALKIYDTFQPEGNYPAVKSQDVEMPDGSRLSDQSVVLTAILDDGSAVELLLYGGERVKDEEVEDGDAS